MYLVFPNVSPIVEHVHNVVFGFSRHSFYSREIVVIHLVVIPLFLKAKLLCNLSQNFIALIIVFVGIKPRHKGLKEKYKWIACLLKRFHFMSYLHLAVWRQVGPHHRKF